MAAKRRLAGHVGVPISDPSDIDDERDSRLSPPANVERNRKTLSLEVHEPPQEPTDDGFVQPQAPKRTRDELVSAKIQEMQSTEVTGFLIKPDFASHRPLQDRMIMRLPFARTVSSFMLWSWWRCSHSHGGKSIHVGSRHFGRLLGTRRCGPAAVALAY